MHPDRVARVVGLGAVFGLGVGTSSLHLFHALSEEETVWSLTFGVLVPLLLSASLLAAAVLLLAEGIEGVYALRIAGWAIGGAAALSAMGALMVLYQQAEATTVSHPEFVVTNLATGGALTGVLVGLYDVRRRRTEHRLTNEREKADRLGQQLAVLVRVLRHDVRNGVNVIAGFAELARDDPASSAEHVRRIESKATELQETSENARRIERMIREEGAIESTDVVECVERSVRRTRRDYPSATIDADLPLAATVSAHPLVAFAVDNVLDNAVEHNDAADPTVEVSVERVSRDGRHYVAVRVADDGPGVPERELDALGQGRETQLRHASGLGLWLVNWIVTESDGEIAFEEREPRGSVVTLLLPAADPASE